MDTETDLYRRNAAVPSDYQWDEAGRRAAHAARILDTGSRLLLVCLVIAAAAFCYVHLDAFSGIGTLLALLASAIVLGWSIMLAGTAALRNHLWKLPPHSRHDYALCLYHGRSGAVPRKASNLLLGMARADIEEGRTAEAASALSKIDTALLQGDELKLCYLLSCCSCSRRRKAG